jgi:hypothetical protein
MAHTINLPVAWTNEEIDDSIWGNSALAWEWWTELERGTGEVLVRGMFGCEDDELTPFEVTISEWLRALRDVALEHQGWRSLILDKDIDADLGDIILQYAVAGKAVYG